MDGGNHSILKNFFSAGVRLMLLSTLSMGLMSACTKALGHLPAIEIAFFRSLLSLSFCWIILWYQKVSFWGNRPKWLIMRGITGSLALITYYITLQRMPLASAVMLQYLSPIFTALISVWFLKEKLFPVQWLFFLMSFGGVLLMKGFDSRISLFFMGVGISSAFFTALSHANIRNLKKSEHPLVIVAYLPLLSIPLTSIPTLFDWVAPGGYDWLLLLAVGIFTQLAQTFMTMAYQAEEANRVASVNYAGIIFALSLGYIFFNEVFNFWVLSGMMLVISGVIFNIGFTKKSIVSLQK